MQINSASRPTTAAAEPPEPPPRNPDRINASLHKFTDSKSVKSLDSNTPATASAATTSSAIISNNNRTLKSIASLDSNTTGAIVAKKLPPASAQSRASENLNSPSTDRGDISSTLNSNGSNQMACPAPMTIDNQQQQRLSFILNSDTHSQQMPQQFMNGMASSENGGNEKDNAIFNANNSNTIALNHNNSTTPLTETANNAKGNAPKTAATVDEKNANNLSSEVKGNHEVTATATAVATAIGPLMMDEPASVMNSYGLGDGIRCDSNRNDDSEVTSLAADSPTKSLAENDRLNAEILRLRKLLEISSEGAVGGVDISDSHSCGGGDSQSVDGTEGNAQQRVDRLEAELRSVRNQLMSMRIERKKLRGEKSELLAQVKQLCSSLQEKEQELRDFIRNFQEKVRETESNNAKMSGDLERERWKMLKLSRDEAERSLMLAQQLTARDMQLQRLQDQLGEARRQLSLSGGGGGGGGGGGLSDQESVLSFAPLTPPSATSGMLLQMSGAADSGRGNCNSLSAFSGGSLSGGSGGTTGDKISCSNDSGLRNSSDRESTGGELNFSDETCENGPCITLDPDSISLVSSQNAYQYGTPKERSPTLSPINSAAYSRSVEQLGSPMDSEGPPGTAGAAGRKFIQKQGTLTTRNGRGGTWGSISRVFARSRNKNKALSADGASDFSDYGWSPLSEDGYAEKLRLLREASQLPMERWRASQVLAWLEVALGMPQYSGRCAENVKSGKVLLELNDAELEAGLGLAHPMHRKKLRLAIEEQRRPELIRYPMITQLGHTWVATEWLSDIGLPQYAESFLHSLVDARMLDTLSKKELEKFLGVTRKFHQASIVHGIHVLRIVKYDRQTLAMRRVQAENVDTDPIVWTNQRFIRWAKSIDLGEYADNLKDSGVHGGLVVLEPSFSGDTMATALGIPPSKNIIRRHLTTEFDALILPARSTLGQGIRSGCSIVPITGPSGLQQHYATTDRRSTGSLRISSWKGSQSSLTKAFRFNTKSTRNINSVSGSFGDRNSLGNSTSPTPSYSSSEGGGGIYATIGSTHLPPPTTAPPPPPLTSIVNYNACRNYEKSYVPPGHRVSAPPIRGGIDSSMADCNLLMDQQRRVKSISDIGVVTSQSPRSSGSPEA